MSLQTIAWVAAAVSAFFSAVSAAANWYNANTFRRQLKNTTIDACVSASAALQAATSRVIEFKANKGNKVDQIPDAMIWGAYDDAWAKWVTLYQTFRIAQRYENKFKEDAPDRASTLLSELRNSLRDDNWIPQGPSDPKDIRQKMDAIVAEIHRAAGLPQPSGAAAGSG